MKKKMNKRKVIRPLYMQFSDKNFNSILNYKRWNLKLSPQSPYLQNSFAGKNELCKRKYTHFKS